MSNETAKTYVPAPNVLTSVHRATTVRVVTRRTIAPVDDVQYPDGLFATAIVIDLAGGGQFELTVYGAKRGEAPLVGVFDDDRAHLYKTETETETEEPTPS